MIIYSNGCSHTADMGMNYNKVYIDILASEILSEYEIINVQQGHYNKFKNFSFELLGDKNYLLKNAEHGKSNDLIFFETFNVVLDSIGKQKIDFAIIQFSGVNRRVHTNPDGNLEHVNPFDNHHWGIKFEPFATEQSLHYIIILQELFKKYNINYCFVPYMEFDSDSLNLSDKLDMIDTSKLTTSLYDGHRNYFRKDGKTCDAPGHPNCIGYYELSKIIISKLNLDIKLKPIENYFTKKEIMRDLEKNSKMQDFIKKYGMILRDGTDDRIDELRNLI